jgi:hypothetical protein
MILNSLSECLMPKKKNFGNGIPTNEFILEESATGIDTGAVNTD